MKNGCPYIALKWQLKENINFHEHTNRLVLRMAFFFLCFMFASFAFKEEEEDKRFAFLDIGCEFASLFVLFYFP